MNIGSISSRWSRAAAPAVELSEQALGCSQLAGRARGGADGLCQAELVQYVSRQNPYISLTDNRRSVASAPVGAALMSSWMQWPGLACAFRNSSAFSRRAFVPIYRWSSAYRRGLGAVRSHGARAAALDRLRGIRVLQAALPFCTNRKPELRRASCNSSDSATSLRTRNSDGFVACVFVALTSLPRMRREAGGQSRGTAKS